MLGAIIGDIVGSRFEFNNCRSKNFDLFAEGCSITDDSIMTLAVAKALMTALKEKEDTHFDSLLSSLAVKYMQEIGRKYPNCGFGGMFYKWVFSDAPEPYDSFGNGAAMRVSPAGFAAVDVFEAERLAETVTAVTHNHEEGIKGAKAIAVAIVMARQGALKSEIHEHITAKYYPLDFKIDDIRSTYEFNETCQETVPQALECFFESTSFEDAIRTAVSLGGDSDTIGAITGAVAEAYFGVPADIKEKALEYLDDELREIYDEWILFAPPCNESFHVLTKYMGKISAAASLGEWIVDNENDGTPEHPIHFSFVNYSGLITAFEEEFYLFSKSYPKYELTQYGEILESHGLKWGDKEMHSADLQSLDEQCVLALIMGAIRAERFCDGALLGFLKDGSLTAWLKRLKDIDWLRSKHILSEIKFTDGGFFGGYVTYRLVFNNAGALLSQTHSLGDLSQPDKKVYSVREADELRAQIETIHAEYWNADYTNPCICDGEQWSLTILFSDGYSLSCSGSNAYPENWKALLELFGIDSEVDEEDPNENEAETGFLDDERPFLALNGATNIDVLDENLYCYDSTVFSLTPAIRERSSEGLFRKIKEFSDSAPAAAKAADAIKDKIEYIPRLDLIPEEIKTAMQNGTAELIPCKSASGAVYLQIRTTIEGLVVEGKEYGIHRKIKDIPLGTKNIPADVAGAMQCLSMQNQLNQIANGLREISEACEFNFGRVIQGQRDDRLAKLLSSRSSFIQALAMSDESLQRQMLIQAVSDANSARAELAFQIKSDITLLGSDKSPKSKDMEKIVSDIRTAIVAMNNAVQLSLYSYQVLGERSAQLAVAKEHETFIKQVLLKRIERDGKKYEAWRVICSSENSRLSPQNLWQLPSKLLDSCSAFIEGKKPTYYLEDEIDAKSKNSDL